MLSSLLSVLAHLQARFVRYVAVRQAIGELRSLDDAGLADLGIARHQIRAYATGRLPGAAQRHRRPVLRVIEGGRTRRERVARRPAYRQWPRPAGA